MGPPFGVGGEAGGGVDDGKKAKMKLSSRRPLCSIFTIDLTSRYDRHCGVQ